MVVGRFFLWGSFHAPKGMAGFDLYVRVDTLRLDAPKHHDLVFRLIVILFYEHYLLSGCRRTNSEKSTSV